MISMGGINNGAVTGPPGIVNDDNVSGVVGSGGSTPTGEWILEDGTWDDSGVWDDSATWDDGV